MAAGPSVKSFLERTRAAKKSSKWLILVFYDWAIRSISCRRCGKSRNTIRGARNYAHVVGHGWGRTACKWLAPCVDRAWAFPLTPNSPPWWRHWNIIGALRRERFDVAFNFSGSDRTIFVTALLGARWTLAREAGRRHFWNRWLSPDWVERGNRALPVFEQRRQVLAAAGFALEAARFDLRVPEEARQWAETAIADQPVHLSISASTPVKEWPLENWIGLVQMLAQKARRCGLWPRPDPIRASRTA